MNLARCHVRTVPPSIGWAVRMASISIGISRLMLQEECSLRSQRDPRECSSSLTGDEMKPIMGANDQLICSVGESKSSEGSGSSHHTVAHSEVQKHTIYSNLVSFSSLSFLPLLLLCRYFFSFFIQEQKILKSTIFERTNHAVSTSPDGLSAGCKDPNTKASARSKEHSTEHSSEHSKENSEEHSEERSLLLKQSCDGYYLRSKAYIMASRPQLAKKVRTSRR